MMVNLRQPRSGKPIFLDFGRVELLVHGGKFLVQDGPAKVKAVVAEIHPWSREKFAHFNMPFLPAKATEGDVVGAHHLFEDAFGVGDAIVANGNAGTGHQLPDLPV